MAYAPTTPELTLKNQITWRDYAGNIWHTTLLVDASGEEASTVSLVQAANFDAVPTAPIPVPVSPHPSHILEKLTYPKDIGLKTKLSEKGVSGVKVSHLYFRDAANNVWFAEDYKDSAGSTWVVYTLIAAAVAGDAPAVPVVVAS
jgi:hypothetical protein